jgi:hypothetical protein
VSTDSARILGKKLLWILRNKKLYQCVRGNELIWKLNFDKPAGISIKNHMQKNINGIASKTG